MGHIDVRDHDMSKVIPIGVTTLAIDGLAFGIVLSDERLFCVAKNKPWMSGLLAALPYMAFGLVAATNSCKSAYVHVTNNTTPPMPYGS